MARPDLSAIMWSSASTAGWIKGAGGGGCCMHIKNISASNLPNIAEDVM